MAPRSLRWLNIVLLGRIDLYANLSSTYEHSLVAKVYKINIRWKF